MATFSVKYEAGSEVERQQGKVKKGRVESLEEVRCENSCSTEWKSEQSIGFPRSNGYLLNSVAMDLFI